ncbi:hypothetical protein SprV_0401641900 [Sparganum proliferum]
MQQQPHLMPSQTPPSSTLHQPRLSSTPTTTPTTSEHTPEATLSLVTADPIIFAAVGETTTTTSPAPATDEDTLGTPPTITPPSPAATTNTTTSNVNTISNCPHFDRTHTPHESV